MKQLSPVIFIAMLTSACSLQQEKQTPAIEPLQPVKNEKIILQETSPQEEIKADIVSKTKAVPPLSEVLEAKALAKQAVIKPTIPKKYKPMVAKKKTQPNSIQNQQLTKTVTKPDKVITEKIPVEAVKENQQIAKLLPPEPTPQKPQNTITISEESFPMRFGSAWTLDLKQDIQSSKNKCLLTSKKRNFYDGYDNATMYLQLSSSAILIKTDSKVDLSYPGVGIYIDKHNPFSFDQIINESHVMTKKNLKTITSLLAQGKQVTIKLGFWPTWPKTETSSINFSLQNFDKAHQALKSCERL